MVSVVPLAVIADPYGTSEKEAAETVPQSVSLDSTYTEYSLTVLVKLAITAVLLLIVVPVTTSLPLMVKLSNP